MASSAGAGAIDACVPPCPPDRRHPFGHDGNDPYSRAPALLSIHKHTSAANDPGWTGRQSSGRKWRVGTGGSEDTLSPEPVDQPGHAVLTCHGLFPAIENAFQLVSAVYHAEH